MIDKIIAECDNLKQTMIDRHKKYGNNFAEPCDILIDLTAAETNRALLNVKLNRLKCGDKLDKDTLLDIAGYAILILVLETIT